MNILYIGDSNKNSTSKHRAMALNRLGHSVYHIDPYLAFQKQLRSLILSRIHYNTGYVFLQKRLEKWLYSNISDLKSIDLIWVNSGELLGYECISLLKKRGRPIILYNNDDPTGKRDGYRFKSLLRSIPLFDLCVVVREANVSEFFKIGAKAVLRVYMSYDEINHTLIGETFKVPEPFHSDVAFIGTWMRNEKRDEFLMKLIELGIPVSFWGDRWHKSPYWKQLKSYFRGNALGGRDYVYAIQGAKICLGFLSKGNRDEHTQRSVEIPYAGGLLCAERTGEHSKMYDEGKEAVFWKDAEECAIKCKELLLNDNLNENIRVAGRNKLLKMKIGNEDVCRQILEHVQLSNNIF